MKIQKSSLRIVWLILAMAVLGLLMVNLPVPVYAKEDMQDDDESHVRLTWEELKKLLKIDADEIKLSWDEFKKLLAQTGSEVKIEYNIQNGMVVLQRDQFKKLLEQMKPPVVAPLTPPGDYLITKAEYSGTMKDKSTVFKARFYLEIFEKERDVYPKVQLLPQAVALRAMTLDDEPARIMIENGWYVLTTDEVGQHVVDIEFSVKSNLDKGPDVLYFTVPKTAITLLKIDIPLKDAKVEIAQGKHMTISRVADRTKVEAVLSATDRIHMKLHRAVALDAEKKRGPAKIYAETMNLLSVEDDAVRVSTKVKLSILQNTVSFVDVYVPEGYSVLYVKDQAWQEIRDWNTAFEDEREVLTVPFGGEKEGSVIFTVVAEKIFSEKENEVAFNGFQVVGAIRETGYVGAEKKSTAEAEVSEMDDIDMVDIQELPVDLVTMSTRPFIFGLRYLRHPFDMSLKITRHEELPVVNAVIDNASVVSVFLDEGKVITRVVYTIRNTGKQFLELVLPEKAEIWSLYVNGKRELPARNPEGIFMIPLVRSKTENENIVPFDVEILYYNRIKRFTFAGAGRMEFPTTDVVVSKMLWSCYLPVDYQFIHFGGNVEKEKLATGIRPFLGNRVFTYDEISGYNKALESWGGSVPQGEDKRTQELLSSEFRTSTLNEQGVFLNQLRQEIDFAKNVEKEREKGVISPGGAGMALLEIEVPTSGQLYRFAKTLVEGEELYMDFQYVSGWISTVFKIFLLIIVGFIVFVLRVHVRKIFVRVKDWILGHKDFWWTIARSPQGTRTILGIGAVVLWFISKFLAVIFAILFLIAWLKPEWIFRRKTSEGEAQSS